MKITGLLLALMLFTCDGLGGTGSVTYENNELVVQTSYEIALLVTEMPNCQSRIFKKLGVNVHKVLKNSDWSIAIVNLQDAPINNPKAWEDIAAFVNCSWGSRRIVFNERWVETAGPIPITAAWIHEAIHADRCWVEDGISVEEEEILIELETRRCMEEFADSP
jgi:hypothetical protein